jgi:hypothetical protein
VSNVNERVVDFVLGNAEERQAERPRSFFIPRRRERERLDIGELAKLLFELVGPEPDMPGAERMWVEVTRRDATGYVGTLANEPSVITTIHKGDTLSFGPEHVISVVDDWPLLQKQIFVTRRSHELDLRPRRLIREEPIDGRDSGWSALIGDESEEELADPTRLRAQELGYVLDRWPELRPVFETDPSNGEWVWQDHAGCYVQAEAPPEAGVETRRIKRTWFLRRRG